VKIASKMPSRKLKSALLSHQSAVARRATQSKAAEHRQAKALSIKSTLSGSSSKPKSKGKSKLTSKPDGSQSHPTTIPIDNTDTILLLGEANFSFALSLLPPPHSFSPRQICATSYDSEDLCYSKYPDARDHVAELRESGVRVGFGVDAGALEKSKVVGTGKRWSRVVFNFPHVGRSPLDCGRR